MGKKGSMKWHICMHVVDLGLMARNEIFIKMEVNKI